MARTDAKPIRIVIVDDHKIIREGLSMLIDNDPEMKVVAEAGNRLDAMTVVEDQKPDIILLDLDLGGENSLDFLRQLLAKSSGSRVIILTGVHKPEMHHRAITLGAVGLVLKEQAGETLLKAIKKVHAGQVWLDREMTATVLAKMTRPKESKLDPEVEKISTLTEREMDIIALIAEGLPNKKIGDRLFISEKTVRNHLVTIFSKLDVSDRLELAIYAHRHNLIKLDR